MYTSDPDTYISGTNEKSKANVIVRLERHVFIDRRLGVETCGTKTVIQIRQ